MVRLSEYSKLHQSKCLKGLLLNQVYENFKPRQSTRVHERDRGERFILRKKRLVGIGQEFRASHASMGFQTSRQRWSAVKNRYTRLKA